MPVLHARDVAEAKVAAIGTVNPRPPGALNSIVQASRQFVARLLDWHVREQVEFNRATVSAIEALLEALNENNRALARWRRGGRNAEIQFLRRRRGSGSGFSTPCFPDGDEVPEPDKVAAQRFHARRWSWPSSTSRSVFGTIWTRFGRTTSG